MKLLNSLKKYFLGDLIADKQDAVKRANALIIFYVIVLSILLLVFVQLIYLFNDEPKQRIIGLISLTVFTVGLFSIRWCSSIRPSAFALLTFSSLIASMNLWLYPETQLNSGIHITCNLVFAFNLLGRRIGLWFTIVHMTAIVLLILFPSAHDFFPFLTPIFQSASERITSLFVLMIILVLLILYYQNSHERAAKLLGESNVKLSESNKAAEEMNKLKSNFLANMSHEIRTPLNGILGLNELMRDQANSEEMLEFLDIQSQSGQRLLNTINGILSLAKLEVDSEYFNLKRVNLLTLTKEVIDNQRGLAEKGQLSLSFNSNVEYAMVYADETMIYQVISNLIGNAIKFTNPGGKVDVSITYLAASKDVSLDVKDTGIGIASDFLQKVFEPFEQESSGQNRKYQGTGLGLSISKRFVELMGGRISLTTKRGEGSTFSIVLPAA